MNVADKKNLTPMQYASSQMHILLQGTCMNACVRVFVVWPRLALARLDWARSGRYLPHECARADRLTHMHTHVMSCHATDVLNERARRQAAPVYR